MLTPQEIQQANQVTGLKVPTTATSGAPTTPYSSGYSRSQEILDIAAKAKYDSQPHLGQGPAGEFSAGVIKGVAEPLVRTGGAIESGLDQTLGRAGNIVAGKGNVPTNTGEQAQQSANSMEPQTTPESIGHMVGTIAPYFTGAGEEETAAKVATMIPKLAEHLGVSTESLIPKITAYLAKSAPTLARDVAIGTAQTGNLGSGIVQGAAGMVGAGLAKAGGKAVKAAIDLTPAERATNIIKGNEDTMTKKEIINAIDQGRVKYTALGAKDYLPTETDKRAGEILQGKLSGNPVKNVPVIKSEIAKQGKAAETYLEENAQPITAQEQADMFDALKQEASKSLTPSELKTYDQQIKLFSKQLPGRGGYTTSNFYKALKDYEANVAEKLPRGRAALVDPTGVANAKLHAAADIRAAVRDIIGSKHPDFKQKMFDLASLYQAKDNMLTKAYALEGNKITRIFQHPAVKTAAITAGALTAGAVGLNELKNVAEAATNK